MACCKCCCGNVDCEEGQEGKCCCGGVEGTCCQVGEYCCDGVCQEEPCGECGTSYCHYFAEIRWVGEEDPNDPAVSCPDGWLLSQVGQGERQCVRYETVQETECDDQAWFGTVDPDDEDWALISNSLGVTGNCEETRCAGACEPGEVPCIPGCSCEEVEPDVYECVAVEPPP
jgi:hypothetical protein